MRTVITQRINQMIIKNNILSQKDYERLCKTPQEVCEMVSDDLKVKGITRRRAAERLGVQAPVVTIQLSGKKYFGPRTAQKYSTLFGYNPIFLKTGLGYLNSNPKNDSKVVAGIAASKRTRTVAYKYLKSKEMQAKLEELQKSVTSLERERDKALKALDVEKIRNQKLRVRIEKLMDKIETVQ